MEPKHLPNLLTLLRFLLVAPIVWSLVTHHMALAFYLFMLAGVTDALDGLLARCYHWTSRLGAAADPIADKLLLVSCFLTLFYLGTIPLWLTLIVIVRDIWLICGGLAYRLVIGKLDFSPSFVSKLNTSFQILLIGLLLLNSSLLPLPHALFQTLNLLVSITCITSLVHYTWVWSRRARLEYRKSRFPRGSDAQTA